MDFWDQLWDKWKFRLSPKGWKLGTEVLGFFLHVIYYGKSVLEHSSDNSQT